MAAMSALLVEDGLKTNMWQLGISESSTFPTREPPAISVARASPMNSTEMSIELESTESQSR